MLAIMLRPLLRWKRYQVHGREKSKTVVRMKRYIITIWAVLADTHRITEKSRSPVIRPF